MHEPNSRRVWLYSRRCLRVTTPGDVAVVSTGQSVSSLVVPRVAEPRHSTVSALPSDDETPRPGRPGGGGGGGLDSDVDTDVDNEVVTKLVSNETMKQGASSTSMLYCIVHTVKRRLNATTCCQTGYQTGLTRDATSDWKTDLGTDRRMLRSPTSAYAQTDSGNMAETT